MGDDLDNSPEWKKIIAERPEFRLNHRRPQKVSHGSTREQVERAKILMRTYDRCRHEVDPQWKSSWRLTDTFRQAVLQMERHGLRSPQEWPRYLDQLFDYWMTTRKIPPPPAAIGYDAHLDYYAGGNLWTIDVERADAEIRERFPLADPWIVRDVAMAWHMGTPRREGPEPEGLSREESLRWRARRDMTADAVLWLRERIFQIGFRRVGSRNGEG